MTGIGKVDQAILLLKDRLRQLNERGKAGAATAGNAAAPQAASGDLLQPLRELVRRGQIDEHELRRAFVRTLLADSLGDELVGSIEFQSIADEVARMLEDSEAGSALLARALAELG
jgi:hypothetical protein